MAKKLLFGDEARQKLAIGIDQLARAVKATLGPKGRNVILEKKFATSVITKDGVSVAKEIELEDPYENMGAQMVKEVAEKTGDLAGDGTTTATVLAQIIYKEGLKNVTAGSNPTALKRGIDKAVINVIENLKKIAKPIKDQTEIAQVASIAANNDITIGKLIAEAMEKVGKDGVVTIEEAKSITTSMDVVEGMQLENGYLSPHFITDKDSMKVVLDEPYILIHEKKIVAIKEILSLLEKAARNKKSLLIIAEDLETEVLTTLVVNKLKGNLNCCAIKAPSFGDRRKAILEDIAVLTNAKVITEDLGIKLENINLTDLGRAKKIIISKDETTIIEGAGEAKDINNRIVQLKKQIEETEHDYDKQKTKERLAKLTGGIAIINVGAATETEMKEKKARVEDALHATRAAIEEGIVPGGGVAFLRCISKLDELKLDDDEQIGVNIIKRALEEPIRQIVKNAGKASSVIVNEVKNKLDLNIGYNAETNKYVDMIASGIIDPTKVSRTALENAASIASLLLITEVLVADIVKETADK